MGLLQGKVALVTGCARYRGLGRGIARALAQAGADLAVTDVQETGTRNLGDAGEDEKEAGWRGLSSLVEELRGMGVRAQGFMGDVGRREDAERMLRGALDAFGHVDILVNNAGAPHGADRALSWEVPEAAFDDVIRINLKGPFLMSTAIARHFIERGQGGRIVNISSTQGKRGGARSAVYSASKFGVVGLTQSMALELAPHQVTVNAVCPGAMDTARLRRLKSGGPSGTGEKLPPVPMGRLGVADDIARAVLFLVDPAATYVTGECINVNGGSLMV